MAKSITRAVLMTLYERGRFHLTKPIHRFFLLRRRHPGIHVIDGGEVVWSSLVGR
jgi:hypothetical protein